MPSIFPSESTEQILDKADQLLFDIIQKEYGAEIPSYLLNQFRYSRPGRTPSQPTPSLSIPPDLIPETFFEFLVETSKKSRKTLMALASRGSSTPIMEPEILPACVVPFIKIENLLIDLTYKSPFGTATLIHPIPFLKEALQTSHPTGSELTAEDLLRRFLGVFKIHYIFTTLSEFQRVQTKRIGNEKLEETTFLEIEEKNPQEMIAPLTLLESLELLPKKQDPNKKYDLWDKQKIEETLLTIKDVRPKEGSHHRTEWTALSTENPYLNLENTPAQEKLIAIFPAQAQKRFECFPLHLEENLITLAVHQLPPIQVRTEIITSLAFRCKIQYILANRNQVMGLINKALSTKVNIQVIASEIEHEANTEDLSSERINIEELIKGGKDDETTVIQLLQALIVQAVQDKATDIHVASAPEHLSIRFRVDGILLPYPHQLPKGLDKPLITRIKIVSSINTQKTGMPEDGKYATKLGGLEYEIRVTTCPTIHGEKAILRIQPKSSTIPTLESLGFQGIEKQVIIRSIDADHGLVVICGPTGSGKSTTLYAAIGMIDRSQWNVITGEQPVEIKIPGCEQTSITNQLSFAKFVTATLRQDPDYIMIGETRDKETTEELVRAAITGHNVMTTLHTNSAASAPARLIDLGAKPYLLADALVGVCAQRLLRKLCGNCSQKVPIPSRKKLSELGIREDWMLGNENMHQPIGCKMCRNTGYAGRVAVIEGYTITNPIREIIQYKNADPRSIQALMENQGSKSLFQHAVENVARGICSLSDALAIQSID